MMAASITAKGTTLEVGRPVVLFRARIYGGGVNNAQNHQYDVARDGRFLINAVPDEATAPHIDYLVEDLTASLREVVPARARPA